MRGKRPARVALLVLALTGLHTPVAAAFAGSSISTDNLAPALGECGVTWTARTSGTTQHLRRVTWTGTQLVAVGDSGTILTSPDGVVWTPRTSGTTAHLRDIVSTGSQLVAVGGDSTVLTSPDGLSWTSRKSGTTSFLTGVTWTGTQLVAVGGEGTVLTSPDGITWTPRASGVDCSFSDIAWTGTQLVVVGNPVGASMTIHTSPDGTVWAHHAVGSAGGWLAGVAGTTAQIVAVGVVGVIFSSSDGVSWTQCTSGTSSDLRGVTTTDRGFAAVGRDGTILTSSDGVSWSVRTSGVSTYLRGITSTGSQLVAVGEGGTILTSPCVLTPLYVAWIPVASHAGGLVGSQWRTDLGLLDTGDATANVQVTLFVSGTVASSTTYVPAGSQSILVDVVSQLGMTGSGALQILSDQPLKVTSRTYNLTPAGTFGQDYPAYTTDQGLSAGQSAYLPHLIENSAFRTNIGLTNTGLSAAQVVVELHDGDGQLLTSYSVALQPGEWKQETQPFQRRAGRTNMARGYAKVTVISGSGVLAHASVIDNATGDPTTMTMQR